MRRLLLVTLMLSPLIIGLLIPGAYALERGIYHRFWGDPRPGNEIIVQVVFARGGPEDPRPIHDASYVIYYRAGDEVRRLDPLVREGIASVRVKVPLSMLLGGRIDFKVNATSEFYGITATREFSIYVSPDPLAGASILMGAVALVSPLLARRWRMR